MPNAISSWSQLRAPMRRRSQAAPRARRATRFLFMFLKFAFLSMFRRPVHRRSHATAAPEFGTEGNGDVEASYPRRSRWGRHGSARCRSRQHPPGPGSVAASGDPPRGGIVMFGERVDGQDEVAAKTVLVDEGGHSASPALREYFITGSNDDEAGVMATYGATPGPGSFAHEFVTTPGMLAVINGVVAGILAGIVALRFGWLTPVAAALGVAVALITCAL